MTILITIFAFIIIGLGILTVISTPVLAAYSKLFYWWDQQAKQGTIILMTLGTSLIIFGSILIY